MRTNDCHKGYDEFWESLEYVELDSYIPPNKAVFYIEGQRGVFTTLKLPGKFMDDFESREAIQKLKVIGALNCEKAFGRRYIEIDSLIENSQVFDNEMTIDGTTIRAWSERYPNNKGFEVFLKLSR